MCVQARFDESSESANSIDRAELEHALGEVDQSLADMYRHAVRLLADPERSRAAISLMSHGVREISNALPRHLGLAEDVQIPPRADVKASVEKLADLLTTGDLRAQPSAPEVEAPGLDAPDSVIGQPLQLRRAAEDVVADHAMATQNASQSRAFVAAWELSASKSPTAVMFGSVFAFFMRYAHLGKAELPSESDLQSHFARFEVIVWARLADFFAVREELDDILVAANASTLAAIARDLTAEVSIHLS